MKNVDTREADFRAALAELCKRFNAEISLETEWHAWDHSEHIVVNIEDRTGELPWLNFKL